MKVTVRKYKDERRSGGSKWLADIRSDNGSRERKFFETKGEAEAYAQVAP